MLYFAYGSNLHPARMGQRVPSATPLGPAHLDGHRLAWDKLGRDRTGKCTVHPTTERGARVHGVIYRFDPRDKPALDRAESLGAGYREQVLEVVAGGQGCRVFLYVAQEAYVRQGLRPFAWYRDFVLVGARRHGLPAYWVAALAQVAALPDPDPERWARNRALLAS